MTLLWYMQKERRRDDTEWISIAGDMSDTSSELLRGILLYVATTAAASL